MTIVLLLPVFDISSSEFQVHSLNPSQNVQASLSNLSANDLRNVETPYGQPLIDQQKVSSDKIEDSASTISQLTGLLPQLKQKLGEEGRILQYHWLDEGLVIG